MKELLIVILLLEFAITGNFLISWGIIALASKCFEFAFAWKYVWFLWIILSIIIPLYFKDSGNKK